MDIKKVVVIGSGTMGSGIAAQVANAGVEVTLLDLPSNEGSRNAITEKAKDGPEMALVEGVVPNNIISNVKYSGFIVKYENN